MKGMQTVPISKAQDRLNELVDEASSTPDEWETLQETLFWLSQPGIREDLAQAHRDYQAGETMAEEQVRHDAANYILIARISHRAHVHRRR